MPLYGIPPFMFSEAGESLRNRNARDASDAQTAENGSRWPSSTLLPFSERCIALPSLTAIDSARRRTERTLQVYPHANHKNTF